MATITADEEPSPLLHSAQNYDSFTPYPQSSVGEYISQYEPQTVQLGYQLEFPSEPMQNISSERHGQVDFGHRTAVGPRLLEEPWDAAAHAPPSSNFQNGHIGQVLAPGFVEPLAASYEIVDVDELMGEPQSSPTWLPIQTLQTKNSVSEQIQAYLPDQKGLQNLPVPSNPPTKSDWDAYRTVFTQLYSIKKLRDVMEIMEEKYRFIATPKMFNTKITKWRINKNYKSHERRDIAQVLKFYEMKGEECPKEIRIDGQPLQIHRIRRHCKNQELSPAQIPRLQKLDAILKAETSREIRLEDLRCRLVSSSKPRKPLTMPPQQGYFEQLLFNIDILCELSIQSRINEDKDDHITNKKLAGVESATDLRHVFYKFSVAFDLLDLKQEKRAWHLINKASDMIKFVFSSSYKHLLINILKGAVDWSRRLNPDLFQVIWRHISNMALTKLGGTSPISKVCYAITCLEHNLDIHKKGFQLAISRYEHSLPPNHDYTLGFQSAYSAILIGAGDLDEVERIHRLVLNQYETVNRHSYDCINILGSLGYTLYLKGAVVEAESVYRDAVQRCEINSGKHFLKLSLSTHILLSLVIILDNRGVFSESQLLLQNALEQTLEHDLGLHDSWEIHEARTIIILKYLKKNLEKQGKMKDAENLRLEYPYAFD